MKTENEERQEQFKLSEMFELSEMLLDLRQEKNLRIERTPKGWTVQGCGEGHENIYLAFCDFLHSEIRELSAKISYTGQLHDIPF